jgi:hypothetical protein
MAPAWGCIASPRGRHELHPYIHFTYFSVFFLIILFIRVNLLISWEEFRSLRGTFIFLGMVSCRARAGFISRWLQTRPKPERGLPGYGFAVEAPTRRA